MESKTLCEGFPIKRIHLIIVIPSPVAPRMGPAKATQHHANLWVGGERSGPPVVILDLKNLLKQPYFTGYIKKSQRDALLECDKNINQYGLGALIVFWKIWVVMYLEFQNREPLSYPNFSNQSKLYINYLRRHGTQWIGLRLHFPFISCDFLDYLFYFSKNHHEDETLWVEINARLRHYTMGEYGQSPYSWISIHEKYSCPESYDAKDQQDDYIVSQ